MAKDFEGTLTENGWKLAPAPFDMGMAGKVQAFLKAGQGIQGGQGEGIVKVSSPSGSNLRTNLQ